MKKLLLGFLFFLRIWHGYAQQDSTLTVELEDLVIHGNRLNTTFRESARNINIVTKTEIQRIPAQSIPEILSYVPGVDIRQRGPVGVQSDIGIRGGSFEQSLILVNGIKMTDPQTGHHAMNIPLNLYNIDRIEVLKGPGARIYGQNAFSGAVNFITSIPEKRSAGLRLYGGQHGLFGGNIDLALPGKFGNYLSISRDVSDGYRHNTDFKINNLFYQSDLETKGGQLELLAGLSGRKFGANGFYASPDYTEQYEEVLTSLVSLGLRKKINQFSLAPRIYWRRNQDNYFFVRDQPEIYENLHVTQVGAVELNGSWVNALGETGMGIEYRHESITGNWVRNGEKTPSNLDGYSRQNLGLFLEHHFTIAGIDLTPGVFIGHYSDFGWNAFPGMDLGYHISPNLRIYGNIGRTFRIPTFYDLYYQSPVEQGNPDLKPEEAISYDAGIRYMKPGIQAEMSFFYRNASELIDWVAMPLTDSTYLWKASNYSQVKTSGIEIACELLMEKILNDRFFIKDIRISYNFINADLLENDLQSRYTLENLRHQLIMGIDHRICWQIHHHFMARFNQREKASPYWVLDSRIYWDSAAGHTVFIEATNLANSEYTEVMTPMPGRWLKAGLSYRFDLK